MGPQPADLATRFWSKVAVCAHGRDCAECCWSWQGSMVKGYGKMFVPKALRQGKSQEERAPRVCWFVVHGVWPGDLHVLHTCDNPPCVQPAHLWLGTMDDNQKDSMRKGRRPTGDAHGMRLHPDAVTRGVDIPWSLLTEADVQFIRAMRREGWTQQRIAQALGRGKTTIEAVLSGRTWRHIP